MKIAYCGCLYESIRKGKDYILPKGTKLFHSTIEDIQGDLREGGYDGISWFAYTSNISQSYIPSCGLTSFDSSRDLARPSIHDKEMQKQLGIEYDLSVENGKIKSYSIIAPQYFIDIRDKAKKISNSLYSIEKQIKELNVAQTLKDNEDTITEEEMQELIEKETKLINEEKRLDAEYKKYNVENLQCEYVNKKLKELGYEGTKISGNNYSYQLKISNGKIMPANYKAKGKLYIGTTSKDLKIYDMSTGESDLTDVQYHDLETFDWAKQQGYDGVKIDDFAQFDKFGNVGHPSIGLFNTSLKTLSFKIIDACHPDEYKGNSKEYTEYLKGNK